jgi:hypothetical protein
MGRKHRKDKSGARRINVEIAPGNQAALDRYIKAYNRAPRRATPKLGYTDVVNEALDRFLRKRAAPSRGHGRGSRGEPEFDEA